MNKRIWAVVGLAYMLMLLGFNFYSLYTGGMITGIPTLLFSPVIAGFAAVSIYNYRNKKSRLSLGSLILLVAACAAGFVYCLYVGIPALMRNF